MKALFITVFTVFFSFCTIRFVYGLDTFSFAYSFEYLSSNLPDLREDFKAIIEHFDHLIDIFEEVVVYDWDLSVTGLLFDFTDLFKLCKVFFEGILVVIQLPIAFLLGLFNLFKDFSMFFRALYHLLFGIPLR